MKQIEASPGVSRMWFQHEEVEDFNVPIGATGAKHVYGGDGTESQVAPGLFRIATGTTADNQSFFNTWPFDNLDTGDHHFELDGLFKFHTGTNQTGRKFAFGFATTGDIDASIFTDVADHTVDATDFFGVVAGEDVAELHVGAKGTTNGTVRSTLILPSTGYVGFHVSLNIRTGVADVACRFSRPGAGQRSWLYPYGGVSGFTPYITIKDITLAGTTLSPFWALQCLTTTSQIVECDYLSLNKNRVLV